MKTSLHNYMKVGIVHPMAFPACASGDGPILESLQILIEDEFFSVVELAPINDPAIRAEAVARLKAAQMTVVMAAQPVVLLNKLNHNSLDEAERKRAVDRLTATIEQAAEMGLSRVALLSGPDPAPDQRPAAMEALASSLKTLSRVAERHGIDLALEVFDRDVDKKALIGPVDTALAIAREVKPFCSNFGLLVDLSHTPLLGESPREALLPVKEYLMHIHIGNAVMHNKEHPAYGDHHPRFGVEGGVNDVPEVVEFLQTLLEIGYLAESRQDLPIVSFEVKPMPGEDVRVVIANAKRTLIQAWRLV